MCGHGTIGVVVTLAHLGRIEPGTHRLETPVGVVAAATTTARTRVTVENVPSYRLRAGRHGRGRRRRRVTGDVAWGGNWFFLVSDHGQD